MPSRERDVHRRDQSLVIFCLGVALAGVCLLIWGHHEQWDTGQALGVAGLAVSVAGFSVAIWQLRKTQDAAAAAFDAIHDTLKGVAASRLAALIVELRWALQEYERGIGEASDFERARAALTRWRENGGDAETLIERRFGINSDALAPLQRSRELARETKSRMFGEGGPEPDLQGCLEIMERASDALGPLLEQLWPTDHKET